MEPFGHRESSLFAEPTENKSFSERNPVFFSSKLEMIPKIFRLQFPVLNLYNQTKIILTGRGYFIAKNH
jgi:hypothetical protein